MRNLLALTAEAKLQARYGDWPGQRLISASEVNRNQARIARLLDQARIEGVQGETLIEIGPGAVVASFAKHLTRPSNSIFHPRKWLFNCIRLLECSLRQNFARLKLTSLEPVEIANMLSTDRFSKIVTKIIVLDRDSRVLQAAQNSVANIQAPVYEFSRFNLNTSTDWMGERCTLVCAYKCLHLCFSPSEALNKIAKMIKPNGLLSTSYQIDSSQFTPIDSKHGLYRFRG